MTGPLRAAVAAVLLCGSAAIAAGPAAPAAVADPACAMAPPVPAAEWTHAWKNGTAFAGLIADPFTWAATQFLDDPEANAEAAGLSSFEADIDHDGQPELFVDAESVRGQKSSAYLVFRRAACGFHYLGSIGMNSNPEAFFRVLPLGADGRPRLLTYSAGSGAGNVIADLQTYTYDGQGFPMIHVERLDFSRPDAEQRLGDAFGR